MSGKNQVTLTFAGDERDLMRSFDRAGDGSRRFTRDVGHASSGLGRMRTMSVAAGVALGNLAVNAIQMAGRAAVDFAVDSVKAFVEAEKAQTRLQDAFTRFPKLADTNIEAFRKLNKQLAQKTRFDDDATASGQAVLAQFKITGAQIKLLTPLLQDYAAKTGKDLPDAANILGKALLGKGRALAEIGIKFKDAGSVAANFDQIVAGLRTQVGGFAEQEGKTAAGKLEILKNRFGELKESVGGFLLPIIMKASDALSSFADKGAGGFGELGAAVGSFNSEELADFKAAVKEVTEQVGVAWVESLAAIKVWIKDNKEEIKKFTSQIAEFTRETGPAFALLIKLTAVHIMIMAKGVMLLVDALDRLSDWYERNAGWISKFSLLGGLIDKASAAAIGSNLGGSRTVRPVGSAAGGVVNPMDRPPRFHTGVSRVPGAPGSEMMAILQAGETVTRAGSQQRVVLEIRSSGAPVDDFLAQLFAKVISSMGGIVQTAVGR